MARGVQEALRAIDGQLMVRSTTTLEAQVNQKTSRERLLLGLSTGFSLMALLLASVGLYGTLAYAVGLQYISMLPLWQRRSLSGVHKV